MAVHEGDGPTAGAIDLTEARHSVAASEEFAEFSRQY